MEYVEFLEKVIIDTLSIYEINAHKVPKRRGIWVNGDEKVKILLAEGLIEAPAPKAKEEDQEATENVEVKVEQSNDQKATEQVITSADETSKEEMRDTDIKTNNKDV